MKVLVSELSYLSELYARLKREFLDTNDGKAFRSTDSLGEAILKNQELFQRIEGMNQRLAQVAEEWERMQIHFAAEVRQEIRSLAATLRKTAVWLIDHCRKRGYDLENELLRLRRDIESIQRGNQYLNTIKPPKCNYPKFVDSRT